VLERIAIWAASTRRTPVRQDGGPGLRHAAYKIAADDLLLSAGVDILFHALARRRRDGRPARVQGLLVETKSGRQRRAGRAFVDAPATATWPPGPALPTTRATATGNMLYPSTMFR
jgi:hypothetical protein